MKSNTHCDARIILSCCMFLAAVFVLVLPASAQTPSLSAGTAAGVPGASVDIPVSFTPGGIPVSSLQFDLTLPSSLGYVSTTTGSAAAAAGKSASGNAISGGVRVIVFGVNQTAIGSGVVAVVRLTIAGGTPAGSIALGMTNVTGTNPDASPVAVSGTGGSVTVNAPADTTPPTISSVSAGSITQTSAVITWSTNEAADSQVQYGTTTGYGSNTTLDSARVTSHSQTLTGLSASTTYHYRVRSRDAAGCLATSPDHIFTTMSPTDTRPPVIMSVTAVDVTSTDAEIRWSTDEPATSQVDYGTTSTYDRRSTLNSSFVSSHSVRLSGLNPGTVYHYRANSSDAAGNLATSPDFDFATPPALDTRSPVISRVKARTGDTTAVITWVTDEASTSQVEWGPTTSYGSANDEQASLVTSHWMQLTGLTPQTSYHFRVTSRDAAGNTAVSADYTLKSSRARRPPKDRLHLSSLSLSGAAQSSPNSAEAEYTGIALTNMDSKEAQLVFRAVDADGKTMTGQQFANPVQLSLSPGQQLPIIDAQLFGTGAGPIARIEVNGAIGKVAGFFMTFDTDLTILDGAAVSWAPLTSFVLPETGINETTRVYLSNPDDEPATVSLDLLRSDGTARGSVTREIGAGCTLAADLYADLFTDIVRDPSDYILVTSTCGLVSFEVLGKGGRNVRILSGQGTGDGATSLYSPQYVVGGPWRSTISVVNLDSSPGLVTMRFIQDGALQGGAAKTFPIAPNGKLTIADQAIFTGGASGFTQGFVEILSDGVRLAGSVTFGEAGEENFSAALPLVRAADSSAVFGHIASDNTYFTGLAVLNPDAAGMVVTIDLLDSRGRLEGSLTETIGARSRKSRLLTELFPSLVGQDRISGYVRVTADKPFAGFALFGTNNLSVLSAIPGQPVP